MLWLAQDDVSTGTIFLLAGLVTVGMGIVGFVMKLIDWKLGPGRQEQSMQCALQHGNFQTDQKVAMRAIDRLTESQASLMEAVRQMTTAITTETEIAKLRHQEVMKSLEIVAAELRALNHSHHPGS